jgi:HEAT repeat protein
MDLAAAGPLAEALWDDDRYVRTEAEEALISLLPRLKFTDGHLLSDGQRACLHRAVRPPRRKREGDLVVAIIGALTQIGDEKAVPHVERLAEEPARGALHEQVAAFARESLPALRQSVEAAKAVRTLVRPADGSRSVEQSLVRPVSLGAGEDDRLLVRPSGGQS